LLSPLTETCDGGLALGANDPLRKFRSQVCILGTSANEDMGWVQKKVICIVATFFIDLNTFLDADVA
jgi:hypothetical protein